MMLADPQDAVESVLLLAAFFVGYCGFMFGGRETCRCSTAGIELYKYFSVGLTKPFGGVFLIGKPLRESSASYEYELASDRTLPLREVVEEA